MSLIRDMASSVADDRLRCFISSARKTIRAQFSPELAKLILETMNTHNRNQSVAHIRNLSRQMANGMWTDSNDAICFSPLGVLLNGQQRLAAIVDSGCSQTFTVELGMAPDTQQNMDVVINKRDAASVIWSQTGIPVSKRIPAILRILAPETRRTLAGREAVEAYLFYKNSLDFTESVFRSHHTRLSTAPVMAAVVKAYFSQDHERLKEFGVVLMAGKGVSTPPEDNAALSLRSLLLTMTNASGGGEALRKNIHCKALSCVRAFLDRRELVQVKACHPKIFSYPVPGFWQFDTTPQATGRSRARA